MDPDPRMIYSFKFRVIHIIVGKQSRTFRHFLLNSACAQTVYALSFFGGDSAWRAARSDSAYFGLETLSSKGPLGGDQHTAGLHPDTRLPASSVHQPDLSELMRHAL